jgi:hypothetical protein
MEHQKRSGAACAYVLLELTVTELPQRGDGYN